MNMASLYVIADRMVSIILLVAVYEMLLYLFLFFMTSSITRQLYDSLRNMLRGVKDPPEEDSSRSIHDQIQALLDCAESVSKNNSEDFNRLLFNIRVQNARKVDMRTYRLESWNNVATAIVQIFPLLGILGTILAIGQSMQDHGIDVDVSVIVHAFTNAIDTTIFGLVFAVFFMVVDAFFQAKANRLRSEMEKYRGIINFYESR